MKEYKVKYIFNTLYFVILISLFSGCENTITTDPRDIHWDRDMCERCKMVISDRRFAAQVINPQNGRVYKFDDIGCIPLWFKEDKIEWKDSAIIWVIDVDTNKWINAKNAFYDSMSITPMAYGFGAHSSKEAITPGYEIIDYEEVVKRTLEIGR